MHFLISFLASKPSPFDSDMRREYNAARCLIPDRYDQVISPPAATLPGVPAGRQSQP